VAVVLAACAENATKEDTVALLGPAVAESDRVALEAECVRSHGYKAWSQGRTLIVDEGSEVQASIVEEIVGICMEQVEALHPRDPSQDHFGSEVARIEFYELLVETWGCLRGEGYKLLDPPSLDAWLESWDNGPWDPYGLLLQHIDSKQEWDHINDVCPQGDERVFASWDPIQLPRQSDP
jgi:hypothetical protein